jgi:predicted esterase
MPHNDPHAGQPVRAAGTPIAEAEAAVILLHGRGASADSILSLAEELQRPDLAYLAPQAEGWTWYPHSFLAPLDANEPKLSSALASVGRLVARVEEAGIERSRIVLAGFSQGACLAAEFTARNAGRWGGVVILSGGVIGPEHTPRNDSGDLAGTPVYLGCSDRDPHIPRTRVQETAELFKRMGADVDARIYPGLGHTVNAEEIDAFRTLLARF